VKPYTFKLLVLIGKMALCSDISVSHASKLITINVMLCDTFLIFIAIKKLNEKQILIIEERSGTYKLLDKPPDPNSNL